MSGILDMLTEHLDSRTVRDLGNKIGADEDATQKAVAAALPMLIGGLARNANTSPSGAESLANALDRDHDGSLLGNLGDLLGGGSSGGLGGLLDLAGDSLAEAPRKRSTARAYSTMFWGRANNRLRKVYQKQAAWMSRRSPSYCRSLRPS